MTQNSLGLDPSFMDSIKKTNKPEYNKLNKLMYNPSTGELEGGLPTGLDLPDYSTGAEKSWYDGLGSSVMSGLQNKDLMSGLGTATNIKIKLFRLYNYFAGDTHDMDKEKLKGYKTQNAANELTLAQKQKFYDPAQNKLIG